MYRVINYDVDNFFNAAISILAYNGLIWDLKYYTVYSVAGKSQQC